MIKLATGLVQTILLLSVSMLATTQPSLMRGTPIGVGDVAPDFALEDQNVRRVTLSDARGKTPVVLIFYRGYW